MSNTIENYELLEEIGSGGFGVVYRAIHRKSLQPFAVKTSQFSDRSLIRESKTLKHLSGIKGVPKYYENGKTSKENYLVMELLSDDFKKYFHHENGEILMESLTRFGRKAIKIIEKIHNKGIIHRDIKPQQFLVSLDKPKLYLADYGLSKKFMNKNKHKIFEINKRMKGTVGFASIHTHLMYSLSRRDDLESLFYTLAFLKLGKLPWQDAYKGYNGIKKWKICHSLKLSLAKNLFFGFPVEFSNMFNYIKRLGYEELPSYKYFINQFDKLEKRLNSRPRISKSLPSDVQKDSIITDKKKKSSKTKKSKKLRISKTEINNTPIILEHKADENFILDKTEEGVLPSLQKKLLQSGNFVLYDSCTERAEYPEIRNRTIII